jgi:hypothetical protein
MKNKTLSENAIPPISGDIIVPPHHQVLDDKIYLLKNYNGSYLFWDLFEGWQNTWDWKFAYFFFSLEDAQQIKQFVSHFSSNNYRIVSRVL